MRKVLVTGGCGFIGINLIKWWLQNFPEDQIDALDSITYASRPLELKSMLDVINRTRVRSTIYEGDMLEFDKLKKFIKQNDYDIILNLAAESHVCKSINGPRKFLESNVVGAFNLFEACRQIENELGNGKKFRIHHVSTDEVFGELSLDDEPFNEMTPYNPRSPYAASKAASDHFALAYFHTYGMHITVSNCTNNFGPHQNSEKLIPRTIKLLLEGKSPTLYGTGKQIRDWIWVYDHCDAIAQIAIHGKPGQQFTIGGQNELNNESMVLLVCETLRNMGVVETYSVSYTKDRPTDDFRYAVDNTKIKMFLGWSPNTIPDHFHKRLTATVAWYLEDQKRLL